MKILGSDDLEKGFQIAVTERATAVWAFGDAMFNLHGGRLAALALKSRLPTLH